MVPDFQGLAFCGTIRCMHLKIAEQCCPTHGSIPVVLALVISDMKVGDVPVGRGGFSNASLVRLDLSKADGRRWIWNISRINSESE